MGIPRLLTYCLKEENGCIEMIDLVQIAERRNGIELLVDYNNFLHNIKGQFLNSLCMISRNDFHRLIGSEYATFHLYLCNFINNLKSAGIILRFYIDGSPGSCPEQAKQKLETWKKRDCRDFDKINKVLYVSCGMESIDDFTREDSFRPVCFGIQFQHSIQSCGMEIVQIPAGEADHVIATDLMERSRAFAILSNDSDFCVFRNSQFIPDALFDHQNDLHLDKALGPFLHQPPRKLICGIVTNARVVTSLRLSSENDLIEMSILAGNDFTKPFIEGGLFSKIGCRSIEAYADVIHRYKRVESIPELCQEMKKKKKKKNHTPSFTAAVQYSRKFYLLKLTNISSSTETAEGCFTDLIKERIKKLEYAPQILAMHMKHYRRRLVIEDTREGMPCAAIAVEPLRAIVYHMIFPADHDQTVTEHGRTPYMTIATKQVKAIDNIAIPRIDQINPSEVIINLRHFHYIMTHQEAGLIGTIWVEKYGRKDGFKYLLLRYFLLLNWEKNLFVSESEFLGLVAMVFGGHKKATDYLSVPICPSPRCLVLGSWLEIIYRTMFLFISKLLFLSSEFPLPDELFSGCVWTLFYICSDDDAWQQESRSKNKEFLSNAKNHMQSIIKKNSNIIKHLTEGCFTFHDTN